MGLRYLGNIIKPGYNPLASNITTGVNVVQYQGVFTAQQQLQAQANQQWAKDPYDYANTLLLQADGIANGSQNNTFLDSSTNNFTITRNGNTTQGSFTPFSNQPGAWSNYFDGNGDYLTLADSTDWVIDTDYTIELWAYASSFPAQFSNIISQRGGASSYWGLNWDTASGWGFFWNNGSGETKISRNQNSPLNNWVHVAVVKSGTTGYIFFNGVQAGATFTFGSISDVSGSLYIGAWPLLSDYFNGYISNLRLVKGTALYTSNFTPSPTPLTAVTNTKLLTCQSNRFIDNSSNAFAVTPSGNTSVQPFSPFAPQYQWTSDVIGGSGYFDGTGDYLSLSASGSPTGTQNFTIEGWLYVPSASTEYAILQNTNSTSGFYLRVSSTGKIQVVQTNVVDIVASSASVVPNAWNYFCVTRSGNTFNIYLNSTSVNGTTSNSVSFATGGNTYVGSYYNGAINFSGYMSSLRVVIGTATAPASIPTAPFTAITNTALLLNFTNAGIYDGTMKNCLETVGNAQISTSIVKYGSGSMQFGSGNFLKGVVSQNYVFSTGDFTVEMWLYPTSLPNSLNYILGMRPNGGGNPYPFLLLTNTGTPQWWNGVAAQITGSALSTNTWTHLVVCRANSQTRMFLNGVQTGSTYADTNNYGCAQFIIGASDYNSGGENFYGYIDDLRITKGVARYTQNFIPPSVALPRQ